MELGNANLDYRFDPNVDFDLTSLSVPQEDVASNHSWTPSQQQATPLLAKSTELLTPDVSSLKKEAENSPTLVSEPQQKAKDSSPNEAEVIPQVFPQFEQFFGVPDVNRPWIAPCSWANPQSIPFYQEGFNHNTQLDIKTGTIHSHTDASQALAQPTQTQQGDLHPYAPGITVENLSAAKPEVSTKPIILPDIPTSEIPAFLGTSEDVFRYLEKTDTNLPQSFRTPVHVYRIPTGAANFTFRLTLSEPYIDKLNITHHSVILKHGTSFVALSTDFRPIPLLRWRQERLCLQTVPSSTYMKVPRLFFSDEKMHVMIMEDAGADCITLKDLLTTEIYMLTARNGEAIGRALAQWMSMFHAWAKQKDKDFRSMYDQDFARKTWKFRSFAGYAHLLEDGHDCFKLDDGESIELGDFFPTREKYPCSKGYVPTLEKIIRETQKSIMEDDDHICMGDMVANNFLIKLDPFSGDFQQMYLIDWEFVHLGKIEKDLACIASEMHIAFRLSGQIVQPMMRAFYNSYWGEISKKEFLLYYGAAIGMNISIPGWSTWSIKTRDIGLEGLSIIWAAERCSEEKHHNMNFFKYRQDGGPGLYIDVYASNSK